MNEVKHHTFFTAEQQGLFMAPIYCNRTAFEGWPPVLQEAKTEAVREAVLAQREPAVAEEEIAWKAILEAGGEIAELTPQERLFFGRGREAPAR
jgi:hypothetical protein